MSKHRPKLSFGAMVLAVWGDPSTLLPSPPRSKDPKPNPSAKPKAGAITPAQYRRKHQGKRRKVSP